MSYRRRPGLGMPGVTPTTWFAGGMDPYAARNSPGGSIYAPYGWGPDFMVGMPLNYTHHIDYVQEPMRVVRNDRANAYKRVPGARPLGPMRDTLAIGNYDHGQYEGDMQSLGCGPVGADDQPAVAPAAYAPVRGSDGLMYANKSVAQQSGTPVAQPAGAAQAAPGEPIFDSVRGPYTFVAADGSRPRCSWQTPGSAVRNAMQDSRETTGGFVAIIYGPDDFAASLSGLGQLRALDRMQRQTIEDAFNEVGRQRRNRNGMGNSGDGLSGL